VPVILRLLGFLKPYRARIALGLICLLGDVGTELAPGLIWLQIIDKVILGKQIHLLAPLVASLVVINLIEMGVSGTRRRLLESTGQLFIFDLRQAVVTKLANLPLAYFNESQSGDLLSRVSSDVDAVQEVVVNGSDSLLANFLRLTGVIVIFCALNWKLGIAVIAPIFVFGFFLRRFNKIVRPIYFRSRKQLGALTARLSDTLQGIRVVKGFAREAEEIQAFRVLNRLFFDTNVEGINRRSMYFPFVSFILSFSNVILIGFGSWLILMGQFTLGGLVAYRSYGRYFYGPMDNLTQINDMIQRAIAAGTRIFEVLDAPNTVANSPSALPAPHFEGHIAFKNVSFAYYETEEAQRHNALRDVSFEIEPGQRVALVGESGAGKSTIFSLMSRLWDPIDGQVLMDGRDLRDFELESVRRQIVTVPQDTFLFQATVAENIRFGKPTATDDEVEDAARAANAHEFIDRLPNRYETLVGERGIKLSGGQRQRISVARAFLANGAILLLDEATSAVEPESERLIYESLQRLMKGRTAIIATHRLSTIQKADQILVLSGGQIVERGNHANLMKLGGLYERMVTSQSSGEVLVG
jgi:ABC-type multidrug transport system fused ATPase/permease subunit